MLYDVLLALFTNNLAFGGGSWADAEVDMASIAVPTGGAPSYHNYNSSDGFSSYSSGRGGISVPDLGPPYIVKLMNLPITVDKSFIEDLFRSRYTSYVKFKIAVDPASNILETHVIKKVAFVELNNFNDFQKVTKWQDLYYKQNKRVIVEMADFSDFQNTIKFNSEHGAEIARVEEEYAANKNNPRFHDAMNSPGHPGGVHNRFGARTMGRQAQLQPPIHSASPHLPPLHSAPAPVKHKPNPFGNAKPVDTLSKQQEIEKRLINLNNTTVQTLGEDPGKVDVESTIKKFHDSASPRSRRSSGFENRRPSVSILKRPQEPKPTPDQKLANKAVPQINPIADGNLEKKLSPAPVPENGYPLDTQGKSLAELLAKKPDNKSNGKGSTTAAKKITSKPTVLKKKVAAQPEPASTRKENVSEESSRSQDGEEVKIPEVDHAKILTEQEKEEPNKKETVKVEQTEDKVDGLVDSSVNSKPVSVQPPVKLEVEKKMNELNNTVVDEERPDFKKQLNDIVSKSQIPKEKRTNENRGNKGYRGQGYSNSRHKNDRESKQNRKQINGDIEQRETLDAKSTNESNDSHSTNGTTGDVGAQTPTESKKNHRSRSPSKTKSRSSRKKNSEPTVSEPTSETKPEPPLTPTGKAENDSTEGTNDNESAERKPESSNSGRGRGRGGFRGNYRGRGSRGRGRGSARNFNLHYVRSKPDSEKPAEKA